VRKAPLALREQLPRCLVQQAQLAPKAARERQALKAPREPRRVSPVQLVPPVLKAARERQVRKA